MANHLTCNNSAAPTLRTTVFFMLWTQLKCQTADIFFQINRMTNLKTRHIFFQSRPCYSSSEKPVTHRLQTSDISGYRPMRCFILQPVVIHTVLMQKFLWRHDSTGRSKVCILEAVKLSFWISTIAHLKSYNTP